MKKIFLSAVVILFTTPVVFSQKLFTYGKYAVDVKEFLRAFNKNNSIVAAGDKNKAIKEYLELFINSKLKVREAYARKYDTLPSITGDVENLRLQIIDNYMNDPAVLDKLTLEAFQRSLKDIHAAHIFIAFKNPAGIADIPAADKKKDEVMKRLQAGEDFMNLAAAFSDDPSAKVNRGDIGYITVFTLPYPFENVIYGTAAGKYSFPYRSGSGWHIFKNLEERKAVGKIKAQQILLSYPNGADATTRNHTAILADSLYAAIMAGADFSKLAVQFSNDNMSSSANGNMQPVAAGQYDALFEKEVFGLTKDGAVTKPFLTGHGYHIVKRISAEPVITDTADKDNRNVLRNKVNNGEHLAASQKQLVERIKKLAGYTEYHFSRPALQAYTDSILDGAGLGVGMQIKKDAPLFKIGDTTYKIPDWIGYAQVFRYSNDGGKKPADVLWQDFTQSNILLYYRDHLEKYNEDFRIQMMEFRDGNLFFEIMQKEIWNISQTDSIALKNYYQKNKARYNWKPSAGAVLFFCSDEETSKSAFELVKKNPADWRNAVSQFEEKVMTDSARYEWDQIPSKTKIAFIPGLITSPALNKTDNTSSFAYIIKVYNNTAPRGFNEARGLVINDYQQVLENKWIAQLKKKYPVVVNQKALQSVLK